MALLTPFFGCVQLESDMDVATLLNTLVDRHQDGLAERWAASLDAELQVRPSSSPSSSNHDHKPDPAPSAEPDSANLCAMLAFRNMISACVQHVC